MNNESAVHIEPWDWPDDIWSLYRTIAASPRFIFLYSSLLQPSYGRYSYLACDPSIVLKCTSHHNEITTATGVTSIDGNPFDCMYDLMQQYAAPKNHANVDFCTDGWFGYWGYDIRDHLEKIASRARKSLNTPDALWMKFDAVIILDHQEHQAWITGTRTGIEKLRERLQQPVASYPEKPLQFKIHPTETRASYIQKINSLHESIAAGDVYEVNLSQRFDVTVDGYDPNVYSRIFRSLVETSPAPFSAIIQCDETAVISSSPELFLQMHQNICTSKPIKGTRPRTGNFDSDEKNYFDLQTDEKDRAENLMIVDLVRNDLGRVSQAGSVVTKDLFAVETYATVFQMVSTIQSRLSEHATMMDAVKAAFPPGSMTGAPKISAMQHIESLEPYKRSVYAGAIGWMQASGETMLSVVIRTLIFNGASGYFQTGGAIVWDSIPDEE
ncbi:MAG TPA: aminodeoxychorismate synthase component I, partial [bacterium]|nr:aminodeoxychorismate synthase component I [bacterium]